MQNTMPMQVKLKKKGQKKSSMFLFESSMWIFASTAAKISFYEQSEGDTQY